MRLFLSCFLFVSLSAGCGVVAAEPIVMGNAGDAAPKSDAAPTDAAPTDALAPGEGGACTTAEQRAIWAKMVTEPIVPVVSAALLDVKGYPFTTVTHAESVLCLGHDLGDLLQNGSRVEGWGGNNEVELNYHPSNGAGISLSLSLGYTGAIEFKSPPAHCSCTHTYAIVVGQQITKDGAPFDIDWSDPDFVSGTEIYSALVATFGPAVDAGDSAFVANCQPSLCPVTTHEGPPEPTVWFIEPLSLTLTFPGTSTQPDASTVQGVELNRVYPPP